MPNFSNYAEQLAAHTKIFHGKDTNKPSAKANFYLHFAEAKYLRRSQRYENSPFICQEKATTARFVRKIHPVPDLQSVRS